MVGVGVARGVRDVELAPMMAVEKDEDARVGDGVMDADPEEPPETDSLG